MVGVAEAERALEQANEAYSRFDVEAAVAHLSTAVRGFTDAGDSCRAAMACIRLGDAVANGMGNLTAGRAWFARARRLVEDQPPCIEQGWVAIAAMGCDVDDPAELLAAAELALDRARRFGDVNLETKALADAGLAHVQAGRVAQGMALLDEAMALASGPADDVATAGKSVCSFFTACYFVADFERAGTWAELLRRQGLIGSAPGTQAFLSSHCDSVQATLLMELGRWGETEELLDRAKQAFESVMGAPAWHPDMALAELRIRQGRLVEAEALLLGKRHTVQMLLPTARLHLARGDHALALATARRGLGLAGDDRLRGAELLEAVVEAHLGLGDVAAAAAAADELASRAGALELAALQARAAAARAKVLAAEGDPAAAVLVLEPVVDRLDPTQLPWLRAMLLLDLARFRALAGDEAGATIDDAAARAALAELDVDAPVAHDRTVTDAVLERDGSWWTISSGGTSVRLPDTKGLRYLADLVAAQGQERHALDLVDRVEGVDAGGIDRRKLGDAGEVLDTEARNAYRHRIVELQTEIDDAFDRDALETAEALQAELDQLVAQLTQAFGLGGRERRASSTVEKARLNVTRALRAAIAKVTEALPTAGAVLDRRVRTGTYCAFEPDPGDEVRWIVQS